MRVCRLSCQRPLTSALMRTLFHAVLSVVTGRVGSDGFGLPKGHTYHSGWGLPNLSLYQLAYSRKTSNRVEFSGIVRPSPASVLLRPTARYCFSKSICPQVRVLISASRILALRANTSAG